ncbi:MAG: response regulator transcription factor [Bifidobacteriaceae bacterium]|jgi:two-component system OmpR family response regulator|nr:response regulator transcription factor [Bifidobacteriaceae bacterium]
MTYRILLLDDERLLRETVAEALTLSGFKVISFARSLEALESIDFEDYDVAILDIMVPDMDGFTLAEKLKALRPTLPVIFLTAKNKVNDKLHGFKLGADDYLAKPFVIDELVARINAIISRTQNNTISNNNTTQNNNSTEKTVNDILQIADLEINLANMTVSRTNSDGKIIPINLTKTEFKLLQYLVKNKKTVLSKDDIMYQIWNQEYTDDFSILDAYISHLRKKLECDNFTKLIHTKWGVGYYVSD